MLGASARILSGHDPPPAVNRRRGTGRAADRQPARCAQSGRRRPSAGRTRGGSAARREPQDPRRCTGSSADRKATARGVPWHVPNTRTRAKDRQSWLSRFTWAAPRQRKARSPTTRQTHSASPLAASCWFSDSILEHRRISRSSRHTRGSVRKSCRSRDRVRRNLSGESRRQTVQDSISAKSQQPSWNIFGRSPASAAVPPKARTTSLASLCSAMIWWCTAAPTCQGSSSAAAAGLLRTACQHRTVAACRDKSAFFASVTVADGTVDVVFQAVTDVPVGTAPGPGVVPYDSYLTRSTDNGATWSVRAEIPAAASRRGLGRVPAWLRGAGTAPSLTCAPQVRHRQPGGPGEAP